MSPNPHRVASPTRLVRSARWDQFTNLPNGGGIGFAFKIGIKLPVIGALCIRLAGHQHGRRVHLRQRLEFKRQRLCLLPGARQGEFPAFGVSMLAALFSILYHSAGLAEQGAMSNSSQATRLLSSSDASRSVASLPSTLLKPRSKASISDATTSVSCRMAEIVARSEEHTSELQTLMRISYAVFCLKKKNKKTN